MAATKSSRWFALRPGEYPPENSAHDIAGELIGLDHVNRTGVLRADCTDAQRRGDWGPAAAVHPAPLTACCATMARLRSCATSPSARTSTASFTAVKIRRKEQLPGIETGFSPVLVLEDDFSHSLRLK